MRGGQVRENHGWHAVPPAVKTPLAGFAGYAARDVGPS